MYKNISLSGLKKNIVGKLFALSLIIPPNTGLNFFGINNEDLPLIILFSYLIYKKLQKLKTNKSNKFDLYFLIFITSFILYTSVFTEEINIFNQTNLRFYFYFILSYLIVESLTSSVLIINIFESLSTVMIVNFLIIVFQIQISGDINGWILNNTDNESFLLSGRLGGLQGGGPNVVGIICALSSIVCIFKILNAANKKNFLINNKFNSFILVISVFNLTFTYSRGSYLALFIGICFIIFTSKEINKKFKIYLIPSILVFTLIIIFLSPSLFLKQTNRPYLNRLAINQISLFSGSGGGNYIKSVYKDYLVTLDEAILKKEFNIAFDNDEKFLSQNSMEVTNEELVTGYLKLKFDYRDNFLPRSVISFYHSNDGDTWNQIGSNHSPGTIIDLIDNDSYFEVGGWGDGQSNDDSFLSGYINEVTILTKNNSRTYEFSAENRDIDFFVLKPLSGDQYKRKFTFPKEGIRLDRPRDYWVALPNDFKINSQDFEVIVNLDLNGIPKGNETIFSQSSILRLNEKFNDQSWRWSIIDGRMYFFWIEDIEFGYADFLGGQSMRSGQLIIDNGNFDSKISDFNVSQYDEITTSHNGFLTMAVEYGAFPIVILLLMIIISVSKNLRNNYDLLIGIFLMMFIQNLTNDLIYSPDVSIYFWLIPMYFVKKLIRI